MEALRIAFKRFVNLVPRRGLLVLGADSPEAMALAPGARSPVETVGLGEGATGAPSTLSMPTDAPRSAFCTAGCRAGASKCRSPANTMCAMRSRPSPSGTRLVSPTRRCAPASRRSRASSAGSNCGGARGRRGLRRLRASSDRDLRDDPGPARVATRTPRVGHLRAAFGDVMPACVPGRLRPRVRGVRRGRDPAGARVQVVAAQGERLSIDRLVRDVTAAGRRIRAPQTIDAIVATVAAEARDGDRVLVMSNGGFDGIHDKLLAALA